MRNHRGLLVVFFVLSAYLALAYFLDWPLP